MSTNESTASTPVQGDSIDAVVERIKQETGANNVQLIMTPATSADDNPATTSAATSGGANPTPTPRGLRIDELIAELKEKTGATSVQFTLTPIYPTNNNN
ncbi:hypothetical protein FCIRC_6384 [Fusarium circinatum]|uniref:Uncharacterized protein n=1 Tax=Fusarium circinatum TaxID=48490 RepID=A0A8H5X1F2_FUSCI|nr:hypothetical protein FCIRC_6384 [Fusarium circinatum]